FEEVVRSAADAYQQAGVTDPRAQLAMAEVHDCFTPTELVLMEDLGFAERGFAWKEVLAGTFDLDGELPVNPDGGLKSFGHPIGAGLTAATVKWGVQTGRWRHIAHSVYGCGDEEPTELDRAVARVVRSDGVASGGLAAVLHGLDDARLDDRPLRRRRLPADRIL